MRRQFVKSIFALLLISLFTINTCTAQGPTISGSGSSAVTRIGTNINPPVYYENAGTYVDLFMHATGWYGGGVTHDSAGYPQQAAQSMLFVNSYPSGIYNFYGEGDFEISFGGGPCWSWPNGKPEITKTGNVTTFQLNIIVPPVQNGGAYGLADGTELWINMTPKDPVNNPPRNFHLIRGDYPAWPNTNAIFSPEILKGLAPFCCIRFMDWMGTNNATKAGQSTVTTWASRPQPGYWGWGNQGTCYENMIALCNASGCDMWINVPLNATDDWAVNMAQLVKQNLNPNLHCYYEIGDEIWASGGWQGSQVQAWAATNPALTIHEGTAGHGQEMAYLILYFANLMQPILGAQGRPILSSQFSWPVATSAALQWIQQTHGAPANYIYGVAGAPYPGGGGADLDSLFTAFQVSMTQQQNLLTQSIAMANQYGVKFCCYEWGQGLSGAPSVFTLDQEAQYDPRMGSIYTQLCNMFQSSGADLCCVYTFCTQDSQYGFWGLLQDIREISSPPVKYSATAAFAAACNCGNAPLGGGALTNPSKSSSTSSSSSSSSSSNSGSSSSFNFNPGANLGGNSNNSSSNAQQGSHNSLNSPAGVPMLGGGGSSNSNSSSGNPPGVPWLQ